MAYTQKFTSTCLNSFDRSLADEKSVTVATKIKPRFLQILLLLRIWWQKKEKILPEADIIIASKISAGPYGSSISSFPPSWYYESKKKF